jgi:predicted enzyme related to lactoylglutathione lyase
MNRNPVGWFEIYVQDMKRARAFYETLLAVKLTPLASPADIDIELWAFPNEPGKAGAPGALVRMDGVPVGANSTLVYFSCEDCALEQARTLRAGGTVKRPKTSIGQYGHIALIFDTEGNLFGLHSLS